uniref:Calponin-homology (CH) domain-containing protein n=1 Tax=Hyaloperonospora arabidopsidis (strain Emoy2) TaxID=559515 RepID=M4BF14_HYAAE
MAASACIQWIRDELMAHGALETLSPPLVDTTSLCEFVTDGRALCLLTNAVLESEEDELPKKLRRSLKQQSKFHALERVQFFLKWCRTRAELEEHQVFTTVQLLDEVNEMAVSETIVALRCKTRPGGKGGNALAQYYFDGGVASHAPSSTSSTTTSSSSTTSIANNANRLSSFLNKFPSSPAAKPPMSHNRTSLTFSVVSSNPSPREVEEPVPGDEEHADLSNSYCSSSSNQSRLRIPSISKGQNSAKALNASATSRSSVISNASSTASTSNDDTRDSRSRSWSSKLSAFSRSHSSSPGAKTPSSTGDLESSGTPQSSPPVSPHTRISIPSAFSAPASAPCKSMSRLSAFLSSVDTSAPMTPVNDALPQDEKASDSAFETVSKPDGEIVQEKDVEAAACDDNQEEEDDVSAMGKSKDLDDETEGKSLKKPPLSRKLIAFLQAVEPGIAIVSEREVVGEKDNDIVDVEAEESTIVVYKTPVDDAKTTLVEDAVAETESDVSNDEADECQANFETEETSTQETIIEEALVHETIVPHNFAELSGEVAVEAEGLYDEIDEGEMEETVGNESGEKLKDAADVAQVQPVSIELLRENKRFAAENEALTHQLDAAEDAETKKYEQLLALSQEIESLKAQLVKEQANLQDIVLTAAKVQEALAADVAEARTELANLQQTCTKSTPTAEEANDTSAQMMELIAQNQSFTAEITSLREDVQTLEQSVQLARDSEDAARYAAQVAFAARDSADELNQQLKDQISQLEKL